MFPVSLSNPPHHTHSLSQNLIEPAYRVPAKLSKDRASVPAISGSSQPSLPPPRRSGAEPGGRSPDTLIRGIHERDSTIALYISELSRDDHGDSARETSTYGSMLDAVAAKRVLPLAAASANVSAN